MVSSYPTVPTEAYTDDMQGLCKGDPVAVYRWNVVVDEFMPSYPAAYWYWEGVVKHRHRDGSLTVAFGDPYIRHRMDRFVQHRQHSTYEAGVFHLELLTERIEKILLVQEIHTMIQPFGMSAWFSLSQSDLKTVWELVRMAQARTYIDHHDFRYE